MGLFLQDFHRRLVLWIVRLKSLIILKSLVKKLLVSVFVPLRSFSTQLSQKFNVPHFCTSKVFGYEVWFFCTSKFLVMKSGFSALQSFWLWSLVFLHFKVFVQKFTLDHTDGPHHMMPPQQFMISAQHWYTVQKELHTERILCGCQSWSRHQILFGRCYTSVLDLVPGLIIVCCDCIGFVMRQSGMDWTKHY